MQQLARLPKDLYEIYDRILSRIQDKDREDAMKLFQWLAFSVRPLKLPELAEVVQVDFESRDLPWFDIERRYNDSDDILRVCSGFVSMTDNGTLKITVVAEALKVTDGMCRRGQTGTLISEGIYAFMWGASIPHLRSDFSLADIQNVPGLSCTI
jgi:hypothetical protein